MKGASIVEVVKVWAKQKDDMQILFERNSCSRRVRFGSNPLEMYKVEVRKGQRNENPK